MHIQSVLKHRILILGFGIEGVSTYRYLRSQDPTKMLGIADQRDFSDLSPEIQQELSKDPYLELHLGKNYLQSVFDYNLMIKSPGINRRIPQIQKFLRKGKMTTSINIFIANATGKIIGVTGSKGKSTSASFLHHILQKSYKISYLCGNIGTPALDVISQSSKETYFILELSSQQIEDMRYAVHIGLFTSFFPDHMDYHGNIQEYFKAKTQMFDPKTRVFYNETFEKVYNFFNNNNFPKTIGYMNSINTIEDNQFIISSKPFFSVSNSQNIAEHHLQNMLGCILIAQYLQIEDHTIQSAIQSFTPLEHRLEYLGKYQEIDIYNDSASVTPDSTIAAIKALRSKNIGCLILGGLDRGYDFAPITKNIIDSNITHIILLPDTRDTYTKKLTDQQYKGKIITANTVQEAVKHMWQHTPKNTTCLFSPGCPSYNQYTNFQERGSAFKQYISQS